MPGNSWHNLRRRTAGSQSSNEDSIPLGRTGVVGENTPPVTSPQMERLLQERHQLESNLKSLVTGNRGDAREAARFPVATFAQRQAQQREWENAREQLRDRQTPFEELQRNPINTSGSQPAERLRTGLRDFQAPVEHWMQQRDREREQLRSTARNVQDKINRATRPIRSLSGQVGSASNQLRDLDRKLAAEGLDADREELRNLGADKIHKADRTLDKVNRVLDAPSRAVSAIDDFWARRDNEVSGAMDRFGPYVENSRRRLSTETGGSGDLFERMQRNRERALARRREQQRREQEDQERRDRALRKKKQKAEEERS